MAEEARKHASLPNPSAYTPNLIRDEWVNIGVLLEEGAQEAEGAGRRARRLAMQVIEEAV